MINCSFLTEETISFSLRTEIEREPVKAYFDINEQKFVCHLPVIMNFDRRKDNSILRKRFNELRQEYDFRTKNFGNLFLAREEKYNIIREKLISMQDEFKDDERTIDSFLDDRKKDEIHNIRARLKRFNRKVGCNLYKINYYITITMDPSKWDSEEDWLNSLFKYFANCSTRKGTKIMGAIEYGDENGHIHFHGVACLTDEFFKNNELTNESHYSTKEKRWVNFKQHPHIRNRFGINEFERIDNVPYNEFIRIVKYVSEYAMKQGNKTFYSRGLPDCKYQYVSADSLYFEFIDGCRKYYPKPSDFKFGINNIGVKLKRQRAVEELIDETKLPFKITS